MVTDFRIDEKKLVLSNGDTVEYNNLISTIPRHPPQQGG